MPVPSETGLMSTLSVHGSIQLADQVKFLQRWHQNLEQHEDGGTQESHLGNLKMNKMKSLHSLN